MFLAYRTRLALLCFGVVITALGTANTAWAIPGYATQGFLSSYTDDGNQLCLSAGVSPAPGTSVWNILCAGDANWTLHKVGSNISLSPLIKTNLCLDVSGGKIVNGAALVLNTCNAATATQNWYVQNGAIWNSDAGTGTECVGVTSSSYGATAELQACNGAVNQLFWPFGFPLIIASDLGSVSGQELINNPANGTNLDDDPYQFITAQQFILNGAGEIQQVGGTNECLTVNGISNWFSELSMQTCSGGSNQIFSIAPTGQFVKEYWVEIVSAETYYGSQECIDISGANPNPGTTVDLYYCNGTNAQAWNFSLLASDWQ